jgi:hypothetical protein
MDHAAWSVTDDMDRLRGREYAQSHCFEAGKSVYELLNLPMSLRRHSHQRGALASNHLQHSEQDENKDTTFFTSTLVTSGSFNSRLCILLNACLLLL